MEKPYDETNLMEIIVDKDGISHLFVNGRKRYATLIDFHLDIYEENIPKLKTNEFIVDRDPNKCPF